MFISSKLKYNRFDFCMLILYSATLLNSIINSRSYYYYFVIIIIIIIDSLGFST